MTEILLWKSIGVPGACLVLAVVVLLILAGINADKGGF
jgi:hypothetical protein